MIIRELYIKNFGKFSEQTFRFTDGVQVLSGENEWGKSTLHAFIRAMLFGMERKRGKAAARDDFTRYEPWDGAGVYGGVMRFSCGGRTFRLERRFSRAGKYSSLVCEDDGEELSVEQGDLEILLGGMTPAVFDSTVSIGQFMAKPGQELAGSLKNYTANYYETGGAEVDLNGTLETLRGKRREAERSLQTEKKKEEQRQRELMLECRYLETDMEHLRSQYDSLEARMKKGMDEKREQTEGQDDRTGGVSGLIGSGLAGIFAGILGTAWSFLGGSGQWSGPGGALRFVSLLILITGFLLFFLGIYRRITNRIPEKNVAEETGSEKEILWQMERIRAEWKEKEIRCGNLREQAEEPETGETVSVLERRIKVLETAEKELTEAAGNMGSESASRYNARASEIFRSVTQEAYQELKISREMDIAVWDGERWIPADRLSRGTLEQIYFSIRMAAAELLLEEPLPVILDETFAFYDDKRLECALKWLSRQQRQVIIFSCQKREENMLRIF